MELKIVKPFGPSVMQSQIPEKLINDLNDYVDEIIKDEKSNEKSQKAVGRTDDRPHRDRGRRDNARPLRARGIVRGVPTAAAHQSRIDRGGDT